MKIKILLAIALWISSLSIAASAQTTLKGIVVDDATKEPIIGASIFIVGTTQGAVTDLDGLFSITVPSTKDVVLKVSYVGYKPIDYKVKNNSYINIALTSSTAQLDELVVVGYAKQKKESVIGSISSIDNSSLKALPVSNVSQALAGKLAGVQVVQPSGEVGNDEANVYVRGMATYGDARPLIVVDGIVRENFSQIDANEIQSINILKDASATAVYGVKGANGVIIVTTRRGSNSKPQVSISAQFAITQPTRIPNPLHAFESTALLNLRNSNAKSTDTYSALELINYRTGASPYINPDTRWTEEVIKNSSTMQQYNANVSGGNNFVKYFVSGGFLTQDGFYRNDPYTNFNRFNFRTNLDFDITKRLKASLSLGTRIENRQLPASAHYGSWDIYRGSFATGGYKFAATNPDGSLGSQNSSDYNPTAVAGQRGVHRKTKSVVELGLNLRYELDFLLKGLAVRGQVSYDNTGENSRQWEESYSTYYYTIRQDALGNDYESYTKNGNDNQLKFAWEDAYNDQRIYGEVGVEYSNTFNDIHSVTALLLANRSERTIGKYVSYADEGIVGRLTYDYDRRYFAEVNACYNGSENFAPGKRYALFPSFALGWLISNEKFITDNAKPGLISNLKLRGSLGWVGSDRSGDITKEEYQALRFIYIQQYNNAGGATFGTGDNYYSGITQGKIANEDVTWETGMKANIGFESSFFNNLIGINFDMFYERRSNILTDISSIIPDYVGSGFMNANVGIVDNKGFELEVTHNNKIGKDFTYGIKGNFSFARNKVVKKSDPLGLLPYQCEEGYPIGTPLMYKSIGVFESYEDIENSPSQTTLSGVTEIVPGDTKYLDFNGDGVIDINDAFRQGYGTVPEIQYGITLSAGYKGFDLSVLFQGSAHSQFVKNWEIMWPFSNNDNAYSEHWRYWTPETSGNCEFIRHYTTYQNNEPSGGTNSITMGNGDYVRLKNLEFGYSLPKSLISKIRLSGVRVYFSSNNLFLWSKEKYIDPDNRDNRGGLMPQTRAFNFGLNVNF